MIISILDLIKVRYKSASVLTYKAAVRLRVKSFCSVYVLPFTNRGFAHQGTHSSFMLSSQG